MTIRHAVAVFGVLAGAGLAARAQDPPPAPAPAPASTQALQAIAAVARGATVANVVPSTFRAQLVVDNRFKAKTPVPVNCEDEKADGMRNDERDPRDRTGKMHCLVCEYGLSPTVAIFVRADIKGAEAGAPLGRLIKAVDALVPKYRSDKLAAFAMFLRLDGGQKLVTVKAPDGSEEKVEAPKEYPDDENRGEHRKAVCLFATALQADNVPFGLAPTSSPSITAFGIGENVPVTVIIYNRLRMAQRWELKLDEITDEKIAEILAGVEHMIGVQPKKK
jgi:hypothetical protein